MRKHKIIVADDEQTIRNGLAKCLTEECPNLEIVGVYADGADVLEHLHKSEVDIVISDIKMPIKTGLDVAKFIYDKKLVTKMIIITGFRDFEYAKKALDYRVKNVILKPIDIEQLLQALEEIVTEIEINVNRIYQENQSKLQLRNLKRQDFFMMLSGTLAPSMILHDRDFLFEGMPLAEKRAAIVRFYTEDGGEENAMHWQDMGEVENERVDAYFIAASSRQAVFFYLLDAENEEQAKIYTEEWAREVRDNMFSSYGVASRFQAEWYDSLQKFERKNASENLLLLEDPMNSEQNRIFQIIHYIDENFAADISLDSVAQMFYLNASYLSRLFKKETGEKFINYLVKVRLNKAKELLKTGKYTISQVSEMVGYTNTRYFRQVFKENIGITPQQYMINESVKR